MNQTRRILLCALIVTLVIAMVPLWGRASLLPCAYMWRYAISYSPLASQAILPENAFPRIPPLCLDILRLKGGSI